jgi:hypothetical protein
VFLKASDNNRAETVANCFVRSIGTYGVPSRVRCDYGGENQDICDFMAVLRGDHRGSALRGSSVHNQRIERLWVDVRNGTTNVYCDLFNFLEEEGLLDADNETHLWALHHVFLPRINASLDKFRLQWNNHGLRTEKHLSPMQLFVQHSILNHGTGQTAIDDPITSNDELLAAENCPVDCDNADRDVEFEENLRLNDAEQSRPSFDIRQTPQVPSIPCPLSDDQYIALNRISTQFSDVLGLHAYRNTLAFIDEVLCNRQNYM